MWIEQTLAVKVIAGYYLIGNKMEFMYMIMMSRRLGEG